jgi:pre-mRNA-splicing helicase BRR2
MLGRAGRPQYDTHGEGVIITNHSKLQFWLSLMGAQLPIESQMAGALADALNAEVSLGGVASLRDAAAWLGYTYLYVRMLRSPGTYGVGVAEAEGDAPLLGRRLDLAHSAALVLDRAKLVRYDRRTGALAATDLGRVASRYYVTHGTLSAFHQGLRPHMGEIELLRLFAAADEFRHVVVREEEKLELARLIDRVPIPVKESLDDPAAKVNVLLQAYVSNLRLEGLALASDMVYVTQSAGRLMRCLFEVCLRRGWARATDAALALAKEVARRQWSSQTPLRQFRGVPGEVLVRLEKKVRRREGSGAALLSLVLRFCLV